MKKISVQEAEKLLKKKKSGVEYITAIWMLTRIKDENLEWFVEEGSVTWKEKGETQRR